MSQALHSLARTTQLIRKEIRESTETQAELARRYNVTRQTINKWQKRDSAEDRSHRPDTLRTTLTPAQEAVVVELRTSLLLSARSSAKPNSRPQRSLKRHRAAI